jgi:hypothetical protein
MYPYAVTPGLGNVGSYLISCTPFLTGGAIDGTGPNNGEAKITFGTVTRSLAVVNTSAQPIYVHFASRSNGDIVAKHHYNELTNAGDSWSYNIRCTEVYVSMKNAVVGGSFELTAELTSIAAKEMTMLSGSGISSI